MIELVVKKHLDGQLDVPSFFEWNTKSPKECVIIEKIGSSRKNFTESAVFAFQSYAPTLQKSATLNEKLKKAIYKLEELDVIAGVHLNSDYNFTDTDMKLYRYQAIFEINYF